MARRNTANPIAMGGIFAALAVVIMAMGGMGCVSVLSNVMPRETVALADRMFAGDFAGAAARQLELLPLIHSLFSEVNPIPVKAAMREIGYDCGKCRLPLCDITAENLAKLKKYL